MRILFALFFLVHALPVVQADAGQALSLAQCLRHGLENNPTLQASRFRTEAADRDVKVARADFLPSLTSAYTVNRISSIAAEGPTDVDYLNQDIHNTSVKLTQILYAGSRIVNAHDKAKMLELAIKAEQELAQLDLVYKIESTFYRVLKARQDVRTATESVTRLRESVKAAEAFFQKELVPKVELLSARVDLADAESQLGVTRNNENRQRVALFALMNLSMDPETEFVEDHQALIGLLPSFDDCYAQALADRPDMRSLDYQRQAANKQSAIALGRYLPMLRLEGGYYDQDRDYDALGVSGWSYYDRDQANSYWQVGLTLSWDLFDGGRSWYESEKFDLEGRRLVALRQEAENTIATGIRKALYAMAEAEQRLDGTAKAMTAATENYTAEQNRLQAGVTTITALLDAQSRLVRAQVNQSNATLDYQLAQSELKFMIGGKNSW